METGHTLWSWETPGSNYSPVLATAGGILFNGSMDRYLRALDQTDGKVLWQTRLSAAPESSPITYSVDGRQYVAVLAGGGSAFGANARGLVPELASPAVGITQAVYPVAAELKSALLLELLKRGDMKEALVFTRTKHRANRLASYLVTHGIKAERIHGNRSQSARTAALAGFKDGTYDAIIDGPWAAGGYAAAVPNLGVAAMPATSSSELDTEMGAGTREAYSASDVAIVIPIVFTSRDIRYGACVAIGSANGGNQMRVGNGDDWCCT